MIRYIVLMPLVAMCANAGAASSVGHVMDAVDDITSRASVSRDIEVVPSMLLDAPRSVQQDFEKQPGWKQDPIGALRKLWKPALKVDQRGRLARTTSHVDESLETAFEKMTFGEAKERTLERQNALPREEWERLTAHYPTSATHAAGSEKEDTPLLWDDEQVIRTHRHDRL